MVRSTGVASCQPVVYGSLTGLVSGGTPPFTFLQTGPVTCGRVTVNPNGTFVFTGPAGFTGPCTFEFEVIDNTPSHCFAPASFTILKRQRRRRLHQMDHSVLALIHRFQDL